MTRRWRALTAAGLLIVRRRAARDVWFLVALGTLVAVGTFIAAAAPAAVHGTVDGGARDAVADAGPGSDVVVTAAVGDGETLSTPWARVARTDRFLDLAPELADRLPPALSRAHADSSVAVLGPAVRLTARDGVPDLTVDEDGEVQVRIGAFGAQAADAVDLVAGALPAPPRADEPVEVVVTQEALDAATTELGTVLTLSSGVGTTDVRVVGVVAPHESPVWADLPEVAVPTRQEARSDRPAFTRLTALAAPEAITPVSAALRAPFEGMVRMTVDPAALSTEVAAQVVDELAALRVDGSPLAGDSGANLVVRSGLGEVLEPFPAQARAALAQMSVMLAGVIGVGVVVVLLMSRLIVLRRAATIALERARGSSVLGVGLRLVAESAVIAGTATVLGVGLAVLVTGRAPDLWPVATVAAAAVVAPPVQGMWLARGTWTGRREPANRADRARIAKRRAARRVVGELGVVALAIAALVSLRGRGLLQTRTDGVDPFLALAPLLLALVITLVVLRVQPWPVRALAAVGRRSRGVLGLLGAARASRAVAALPLLTLTLGVGLAAGGGLLVQTVRDGQVAASWERVGADVRVTAATTPEQVAEVAGSPGVTAVGAVKVSGRVSFTLGTTSELVTVIAVDDGYADVVAQSLVEQGAAAPGAPDPDAGAPDALASLSTLEVGPDRRLPVVVDPSLAARLVTDEPAMYFGPSYVKLTAAGVTEHTPAGWAEGPFVYVSLSHLIDRLPDPSFATTTDLLVSGPGAEQAVAGLGLPAQDVHSRAQWLEARRGLALLAGVEQVMLGSVAAVALLGVVALVATVLSGARERGRALSMLRTLGMSPRLGWWLALAELAPTVLAALLGGAVAGIAVVLLLGPVLGLDVLAGGLSVPDPSLAPALVAGLAGAAVVLLALAVLAEVLAHRRDRLSDVLRAGETA